jgi:hypothetical protein
MIMQTTAEKGNALHDLCPAAAVLALGTSKWQGTPTYDLCPAAACLH